MASPWKKLNNTPPFSVDTMLLLTDGIVEGRIDGTTLRECASWGLELVAHDGTFGCA